MYDYYIVFIEEGGLYIPHMPCMPGELVSFFGKKNKETFCVLWIPKPKAMCATFLWVIALFYGVGFLTLLVCTITHNYDFILISECP